MARLITVAGLGPGSLSLLTLGAMQALQGGRPVILRTEHHPVVPSLRHMGLEFETCDRFYEEEATFEAVYRRIVAYLCERAQLEDIVYAVPGHPQVGEETVRLLRAESAAGGVGVEVAGGSSFLDALVTTLGVDPVQGLEVLDALRLSERRPAGDLPAIIAQVYSRQVASDVKLALMEQYPDEHAVWVVRAAGIPGLERREEVPLHRLDHLDWIDHLTSVYVPPLAPPGHRGVPLDPLVDVMARLRGEDGCPWDREQTHASLKRYLLEESHEVLEAVDAGDPQRLAEELGDVLLQVVFHAQIAREERSFSIHDVIRLITEKLIRRHPHVFGDVQVKDAAEVTRNWERIKAGEKGSRPESLLDGISQALPALSRADQVQRRAARVGFDWPDIQGPMQKVAEELAEVQRAHAGGNPAMLEAEVGDLLFAVVNVARLAGVDPEVALSGTTARFMRRFRFIESEAAREGRRLKQMSLAELDALWERAKNVERGENSDSETP